MDRDLHGSFGTANSTPVPCSGNNVLAAALIGGATLAVLAIVALTAGIFQVTDRDCLAQTVATSSPQLSDDVLAQLHLFQSWGRPDVALVLSGEQHGYLQPCGCTSPQYGGMARRYNFLQALRARGWPIVAADLGNINQKQGPRGLVSAPQNDLKYKYAMMALDAMNYSAVNFGEYEANMPLANALATYTLNNDTPRVVSANLLDRGPGQAFGGGLVFDWELANKHAGPAVGICGLTGPSVEQKIIPTGVQFGKKPTQILDNSLAQLKTKGAELFVLLYQGSSDKAAACADYVIKQHAKNANYPLLDVILCISDDPQHVEPPAQPITVGNTLIVEVGHKGRYVGVVGAFRVNGKGPFQLKYQLVHIDPAFESSKGEEKNNKVMTLMEAYTEELKRDDYLAKYKQTNHNVQLAFPDSEYKGSESCRNCHPQAVAIWESSKHAHAHQTLKDAKNPSNRQYDAECIVCHTVGFGYKTGFENENKTKFLTDVGCESCHGPASEHVRKPKEASFQLAINPYKFRGAQPETLAQKQKRMNFIGDMCMKCHDQDNDNHFDIDKQWPLIMHMNPPVAGAKK